MRVKNVIENNLYKKLIDYAFQTCDCIMVKKYCDQQKIKHRKTAKIITSYTDYTLDKIVNNYSDLFLENAYNFFRNNKEIFNTEYIKGYETTPLEYPEEAFESLKQQNRMVRITGTIDRLFYDYNIDTWKKFYKKNIRKEKKTTFDNNLDYQECYFLEMDPQKRKMLLKENTFGSNLDYQEYYFLEMNPQTREMLLKEDNIYSWIYPYRVEDICFLRKGCYWLESVAHEELCFINCTDKEEYEYLKSIGIEFEENHYIPVKKEALHYEEY